MSNLNSYRQEIDQADQQIVALLEERFNLAKNVANYKIQHNLPVLDAAREKSVIQKNQERLSNTEYTNEIADLYTELMRISRSIQEKILIENEK